MTLNYEENIESFASTFRSEIVFDLRQLIDDGVRINVLFDEGRETLLTVLLAVDEENDAVIFDWGGSESANRRLLESKRNFFVANPHGVRNQFVTSRVWETTYEGRPAFATPIPEKFVRLQRREFFRLTLPVTQRRPCRFTSGEEGTQWEMAVVDICLGGVGLETHLPKLPFERGQIIAGAVVDLDKFGLIEADLEIRYIDTVVHGRKQVTRLGCRFVNLGRVQEHQVQRFVTQVQREERARLG